jgi:hypothetical protein
VHVIWYTYVPAAAGEIDFVPPVAMVSVQALLAVQPVASVEDHVKLAESPV